MLPSFPIPYTWERKAWHRYTANDTWAPAAGSVYVDVYPVGSGGQGGGGNNTVNQGGSGAGSGARNPRRFLVADLPATVAITIGASPSSAGTEGNNGADGNFTSFGSFVIAHGGGGGGTPSADGGAGGGALSAGQGGFDPVAKGGQPSWGQSNTTAKQTTGFGGSSGGDETSLDNLFPGVYGGASGGCGSSGIAFKGAGSIFTAGAGGAGGNQTSALAGQDGGFTGPRTDSALNGGGGAGAGGTTGVAGTAGTTNSFNGLGTGGGGGGFNNAGNGGNGGAGGVPGGGGGGGGSGSGANNSGVGGAGGRGEMLVIEWGPVTVQNPAMFFGGFYP